MARKLPLVLTGLAVLLASCGAPAIPTESTVPLPSVTSGAATPAPSGEPTSQSEPSTPRTAPDGRPFVVTEQARFGEPWAMAFLPGTDWLAITERSGQLWLFDPVTTNQIEVGGLPEVVAAGQGGLGDIMPAPDYASSGLVYLSWVAAGPGGSGAEVGRAQLVIETDSARLDGLEVIWQQDPKTSGNGHFSHRLAFSPGGEYLFVSSGDRQKMQPAQDPGSDLGKIIRMNLDGSGAEHWTLGHRNPLGLAFDADGNLWSTEMGPQGGDEFNLIVQGANYGWPEASNGSHYGGGEIPDHVAGDGFEAPKVWWNPSISPGSLMIYSGVQFPQWQGDAFVGALSGQALIRIDLDGTDASEADHWPMGQRIREVEQGPDGSIWLLEDAGSGRLLQLSAP